MNQPFLYRAAKMTEAGMIIGRGADDRPGEKAGPEKLPIRGEGRNRKAPDPGRRQDRKYRSGPEKDL